MNLVLSFFWVIFSFFKSRERVCYYGLYHDKEGKSCFFEKESRGEQYVVVTAAKNGLFTAPETSSSASSLKSESTVSNTPGNYPKPKIQAEF